MSALLVVRLFQVHPAHSHYLTDEINLLSAQILVPQVLEEKHRQQNREERKLKVESGVGNKRCRNEKMERSGVTGQKVKRDRVENENTMQSSKRGYIHSFLYSTVSVC